jgi:nucleoside-diphosphate-sugar epimerase
LAERLVLSNREIKVRGLVHNPFKTARLARLPVEMVLGDIASVETMRQATRGCDVVVHCAIGTLYETVVGTKNVIRATLENDVKRLIHISSVAVFGYSPSADRVKDERCDYYYTGDAYCDSKIASEKVAFSYYDSKRLPLVVLRPTNIFGPYSKPWTIGPISMLSKRCYVLIDGGLSPSNIVYVDNVVDAIELAIKEDGAVGHAFNISSNRTTSWREFFSVYANMFSDPPALLNLESEDLKIRRAQQYCEILKKMLLNPRQFPAILPLLSRESKFVHSFISLVTKPQFRSRAIALNSHLPESIKTYFTKGANNDTVSTLDRIPDSNLVRIFTSKFEFPITNAMNVLGYKPRVSFEDGMKLTEKWLKYQRLVV